MEDKINGITIKYLNFNIYSKSIGFFYHDKEILGSLFGFEFIYFCHFIFIYLFIYYNDNK